MVVDLAVGSRTVPGRLLQVRFARSGGPGGQNVNKVASKVDLRLDLTGLAELWGEEDVDRIRERLTSRLDADGRVQVVSSEHRGQADNLEAARLRMAALLRMALARPRTRRPTRPSHGSRERRLVAKRRRSDVKKLRRRPPRSGD